MAYWATKRLVPFVRMEQVNTQEEVAPGLTADKKNDRDILTLGLAYYPDPNVALKMDWTEDKNAKGSASTQTNLGLAYMF